MGCKSRAPEPAAPAAPDAPDVPGAMLAASAGDRVAVAQVNGVPIYGDCVATQSTALGVSRDQALEQCIGFELLAQAAQKRGKARDADVVRTGKTEAVRRLLDVEVSDTVAQPGAAGASMDPAADRAADQGTDRAARSVLEQAYARYRERLYRPELRQVAHVLAQVPENTAAGSAEDVAARALAQDIHAALARRRDLSVDDFIAAAQDVAGERTLGPRNATTGEFQRERFKIFTGSANIHQAFVEAAFAVAEAGMVTPPTRTHVGWHVILIEDIEPARNTTVDDAADILVQLLRRERYLALLSALQKNARIEVNVQALSDLQAAEDALRFAPSESP